MNRMVEAGIQPAQHFKQEDLDDQSNGHQDDGDTVQLKSLRMGDVSGDRFTQQRQTDKNETGGDQVGEQCRPDHGIGRTGGLRGLIGDEGAQCQHGGAQSRFADLEAASGCHLSSSQGGLASKAAPIFFLPIPRYAAYFTRPSSVSVDSI
jgi:hypothetical protein